MIEILAVKLIDQEIFKTKKTDILSRFPDALKIKYHKFTHSKNLQRSILGEYLIRYFFKLKTKINIENIVFETGEKGKPFLHDSKIHFNISHSGEWIVAAFSEKELGIDIELIKEPNYNVAKRFFSETEIQNLFSITDIELKKQLFFEYWTIKESYLKAIGTGLTKSLSSFTVLFDKEEISIINNGEKENIYTYQLEFDPEYKLSISCYEKEINKKIQIINI